MIRVMGFDPSLRASGLCLPDGSTYTIETGGSHRGDVRLHDMRNGLRHYIRRALPVALAAVEIPTLFRSGDAALAAGMAQGITREVLIEFGIPYALVHPSALKMFAVGRGDADKPLMVAAANRHRRNLRHQPGELATEDDLTDDNQADAWWLWQMCRWHLGDRVLDPDLDEWLHPHLLRDTKTRTGKGTRWPGISTRQAARTSRANRRP